MQVDLQLQYWVEQVALFNSQAAYENIFLHFNDGLHHFAFSFVKDKQIAEEIVSDAFINLWRNRTRLLEIENLKAYLYVTVKNLSIKELSRNKAQPDFNLHYLLLQNVSATDRTPEELMVSKEVIKQIEAAIENLPPKCKLVFKMVRDYGLRYKEVSQILNISVKTIDAQMAIAAKRIIQQLSFILKK